MLERLDRVALAHNLGHLFSSLSQCTAPLTSAAAIGCPLRVGEAVGMGMGLLCIDATTRAHIDGTIAMVVIYQNLHHEALIIQHH